MREHAIEAGLVELVEDAVQCVEGDKCSNVLEANKTVLKAEKKLNGAIRGGHVSAAERLRGDPLYLL